MKAMPILSEPTFRYHILPDGSMVDVFDVRYDSKVDIENHTYLSFYDEGYEECDFPTLNDLYQNGIMPKEGTCIEKSYDYTTKKHKLSEKDIDSIIKKFKANGLNVTKEAILHNYQAWLYDEKSGYRDEENGYHLFTPCRHNPLSFRATSLHEKCADWQITYTC